MAQTLSLCSIRSSLFLFFVLQLLSHPYSRLSQQLLMVRYGLDSSAPSTLPDFYKRAATGRAPISGRCKQLEEGPSCIIIHPCLACLDLYLLFHFSLLTSTLPDFHKRAATGRLPMSGRCKQWRGRQSFITMITSFSFSHCHALLSRSFCLFFLPW